MVRLPLMVIVLFAAGCVRVALVTFSEPLTSVPAELVRPRRARRW